MDSSLTQPLIQAKLDLSLLNESQREAVTYGQGPLLIFAGAGSGKTRVITYRIAYLLESQVRPWNILAVTFTNKAAAEMRSRVFQLTGTSGASVWISTYHSFCAQFLRKEGSLFGLDRNFSIYDEDDQKKVIKECLKELKMDEKKMNPGMLVNKISREKDRLMDAESFAISAALSKDPNKELFSSIYSLYQNKLDKALSLDFGDLILKTVELLQNYPQLKEKIQERFIYLMVDEYQDTNHAQAVLTKTIAAQHKNICVVGDDDQAIYSWRGAEVKNILEFEKDYGEVKIIKLEQNYRSAQPILDAAWNLVQNNEMRREKKLWTSRTSSFPVHVEYMQNELCEAEWVVLKIKELKSKNRFLYSNFAVFYRTNAQSRVLEDAFRNEDVPYRLVGNVRFYERAEVKDLLAYLRVLVNPKDDVSFKRILNIPPRGIGKTTLQTIETAANLKMISLFEVCSQQEFLKVCSPKLKENISQFLKLINGLRLDSQNLTVSKILKKILAETKIVTILEEEAENDFESAARLDNVQELMNAVEEFEEKSESKDVASYLETVSLITDLDLGETKKECVTLMTVHIAKGLEFPVVFLTGLEEGLFPLGDLQFSQEDLEEERRLAYVGMTRAKDHLFLTTAASRKLFGQTRWNLPSRFIEEAGLVSKQSFSSPRADVYNRLDSNWEKDSSELKFQKGDRVLHSEFGHGVILNRSGSGEDLKVVVQFDSGQWKKLLVKYACLTRS
ncbi:MAG: UvrD-helicase domain-containing protein [Elusimicrobia bacterium]|nr:UvrD-helicase domain-containing protein [Elusimicrobiota bacterium]